MIIWNKIQITNSLKLHIEEVDNRMFLQQTRKFSGFVNVDGDKHVWLCCDGIVMELQNSFMNSNILVNGDDDM